MEKNFDVLIVGGGVAGMSAGLYAKRAGKNVAIIEKNALGGTVATLNRISNFPSQTEIDGWTLSEMFAKQVKENQIETIFDDIISVDFSQKKKVLHGKKEEYFADKVIIATGLTPISLGLNENEFVGCGVSYCAVCDANFFKNKKVCVASLRGSGIKDAVYLSNIVKDVVLIDSTDLSKFENANKIPNLKVVSNSKIEKILGEKFVSGIQVDGENINTDGVFISLGKKPKTDIYQNMLALDERGFIKTDENMQTSVDGVFAIGDVRSGVLKQIVTACSDGAIAGKKSCEE